MKIPFYKMESAGNDYVYVLEPTCALQENDKIRLSVAMSDRRKGVGSDGLVYISDVSGKNRAESYRMEIFNADGSRGALCGNALLSSAKLLYDAGYLKTEMPIAITDAGEKRVSLKVQSGKAVRATVSLGGISFSPEKTKARAKRILFGETFEVMGRPYVFHPVFVGNVHNVLFSEDEKTLDLTKIGKAFENHPAFDERVNTEFVERLSNNAFAVRVYERGSGETASCGSGAVAVAACVARMGACDKDQPILLRFSGGTLTVRIKEENGETVGALTGSPRTVFWGEYNDEN